MKGLIVREPYATLIVEGKKIWEIRKKSTKIRGRILIISHGKALGSVELAGVLGPFTVQELEEHFDKHLVDSNFLREYSKGQPLYAWILRNAQKFKHPKPLKLKRGVQVWVNVEE